jgi:hypothetical protein
LKPIFIPILAIAGALWLTGCGGPAPAPHSPSGATLTADSGAIAEIRKRIATDKLLEGSAITASEQEGTVVLNGISKTLAQKDRAEHIALDIPRGRGLRTGVLNNLVIR